MPQGKGTYGSQVGRPKKQKNSTDNYAQTETGKGMNSTDNMNDGAIDKKMKKNPTQPKTRAGEKFMKLYQSKMGRKK